MFATMSGFALVFAVWSALAAAAGVIMALARTSPTEARSNLSKWIEWAGIHQIPTWLQARSADQMVFRWATIAMAFLLALGIGFGFGALWRPFAPAQELGSGSIAPRLVPAFITDAQRVEFEKALRYRILTGHVPEGVHARIYAEQANEMKARIFAGMISAAGWMPIRDATDSPVLHPDFNVAPGITVRPPANANEKDLEPWMALRQSLSAAHIGYGDAAAAEAGGIRVEIGP
jgi:hypothetical protein